MNWMQKCALVNGFGNISYQHSLLCNVCEKLSGQSWFNETTEAKTIMKVKCLKQRKYVL